jgi:hypothetical protein
MEIHLRIAGCLLIILALMHVIIPTYFKWKEQAAPLPLITRQILYIHTFFIGLTVLLMGLLCVTCADLLLSTDLGRLICLGLFVFWFARLIFQFWGYSSRNWKGKRFETIVHVLFSIVWTYLSAVFLFSNITHLL